jgi:predicted nucleotidyltransferase
MIKAVSELSSAEMERYVQTARARSLAHQRRLSMRRARAWEVAYRAATLLKEQFGVTQVAVFGSLSQPGLFHERSDLDLAVWGLDERDYYRAVACLLSIDPAIEVDLVEAERAGPALQAAILREGILL